MSTSCYRTRIYGHYVQSRAQVLAPDSVAGLAPRAPYLRRLVRQYFPTGRDASVLDLGCGHGALLHFAARAGYSNVRGVDGSPQQVAAAQRLGIPNVVQGDLCEALRVQADSSLDVVVAFDVIEHFTRDELIPFVDHVLRVLKPGGRWIIHVPNGESPFFGAIRYGDLTHELAFTRVSLAQLLLSSRFDEIRCYEDQPVVHGVKSAVRWALWKVIRGGLRLYVGAETGNSGRSHIFSQNLLCVVRKAPAP